jgi:hypothetical protein
MKTDDLLLIVVADQLQSPAGWWLSRNVLKPGVRADNDDDALLSCGTALPNQRTELAGAARLGTTSLVRRPVALAGRALGRLR